MTEEEDKKRIRMLEGLGYCAAVMVLTSIIGNSTILRFFYLGGLTVGLIVIVRFLKQLATSKTKTENEDAPLPHNGGAPREQAEEITR